MGHAVMSSRPEPEAEADMLLDSRDSHTDGARRSHRSCFLCNRRKVRCDKREPCGPCSRAGKPCAYPPPGEPIRRPRKTTMADVASRISHLEKFLVSAREENAASSHRPSPDKPTHPVGATTPQVNPHTSDAGTPSRNAGEAGNGILVQRGSTSQYFNEILLSRVIEEVTLHWVTSNVRNADCLRKKTSSRSSPRQSRGPLKQPCPLPSTQWASSLPLPCLTCHPVSILPNR